MMTGPSATGCSCSTWRSGRRWPKLAAPSASTARRSTAGSGGSSATGPRSCAPASGGGRRCRTPCRRCSRSGCSRLPSPIPGSGRAASPRSSPARSGAGSGARTRACGASCAATAAPRGPSAARSWPATGRPTSPRGSSRERHLEAERPGELVGVDSFFVGRLQGTKGAVWQLSAIDVASSFAWAELVRCPSGHPTGEQTSRLARRVATDLAEAGWRLERVLSDGGGEFRNRQFRSTVERLGAHHALIHAGRPQTNGNVEALHKTILDECWRPTFARYLHLRFTGLKRELETYLHYYNFDRVHHGRLTHGRIPGDVVYGARKVEAR